MSAHVEHNFQKGFILDEVRIRKLYDIVEVRLNRLPNEPKLIIKVFRGDSFSYETDDVGVVVGEDNDDWRAVTRLDFLAKTKDVFDFRLTFSEERVSLYIIGDDRDAVFLLFSDIRDYLTNEVLSGRPISRDVSRVLGLMLMFFALTGFFWTSMNAMEPDKDAIIEALASEDVAAKINCMLEDRATRSKFDGQVGWFVTLLVAMLVSVSGLVEAIWRFALPTNLFLFGTRKQTFDRKQALKGRIFWVVVVGFVVSFLAGAVITGWHSGN